MGITVHNRQRKTRFSIGWLARFAPVALEVCLQEPAPGTAALPGLAEIEVTLVSDAAIARVHRRFMNLPGATDVITFDHGEIVIGVETAQTQAADYGRSLEEELALYIVHGLLHLNGFDDKEPQAAKTMQRTQERILSQCLARCNTEAK